MATPTATFKALQEQVSKLIGEESNNSNNKIKNKHNKAYYWIHGRTRNPRHVSKHVAPEKMAIRKKLH